MLHPDALILAFDRSLQALVGTATSERPSPAGQAVDTGLSESVRRESAALMRVNHCGEICAQALYQGQALASDSPSIKQSLEHAAKEEEDHLAWCEQRIQELGGRTSLLNPLWYAGSLAIGVIAGKMGDGWNLGFLKETERQVEAHLGRHLERLAPEDQRTRAVVSAMQADEASHARTADALGARELPGIIKAAMKAASKVMTTISYRI